MIDGSNELELPFIYTHPGGRIGAFQGRLVQEGRLGLVVTKLDFLTQIKYFCFLTNSPNDTWLVTNFSFDSINPRSMRNMLWLENNNNNNNNLFFFFLLLHEIHINTSTMIIMKTEPGYIFQQFKDKNLSLLEEMRDSFLLYLSRLTSFLLYLTQLTSVHISYLYCFFFN